MLIVACPVFLVVALLVSRNFLLVDFLHSFRPAAQAVLHGRSPYPARLPPDAPRTVPFVYPVAAAWLYTPFVALPPTLAAIAYLLFEVASLGGAMWLLGVRDVRCYAVACAWPAVAMAIAVGTVGSFFPLVVALLWRLRQRDLAWLLVALLVAVKLLLWPLVLYLLLTRRWRAFAATSVGILAFVLLPWAALGFKGLAGYPRLLANLNAQEGKWSLGLPNLATGLHLPSWLGMLIAVGLAALAFAVRDDERALFTVCLILTIAASPLVWLHYFVLLLVPTALICQRLSGLWIVPVVTVIAVYPTMTAPSLVTLVTWWLWPLLVVFAAVRARPGARTSAPTPRAHPRRGAAASAVGRAPER